MAKFIENTCLVVFVSLVLTSTASSFPTSNEVESDNSDTDTAAAISPLVEVPAPGVGGDDGETAPADNSIATEGDDSKCDCKDEEAFCHKYVRQLLDSKLLTSREDFLKEFKIKRICGSDGKFYHTGCEFQCAQGTTEGLTRKHRGHCKKSGKGRLLKDNDNSTKKNKYPKARAHNHNLGEARSARLELPEKQTEQHPSPLLCICPRNYFPVCASNGHTYGNVCAFECAKEHIDSKISIVKRGEPCEKDAITVL